MIRIVGAILAGGRGRRVNCRDKGLLERSPGQSIVAYLLAELAAAGLEQIFINVNADRRDEYLCFGGPVLPDLRAGLGPMGGVEAVLNHAAENDLADAALLLPCDTPAITRLEIARLLETYQREAAGVVFAETPEGRHPCCCVVAVSLLDEIRNSLDRGQLKIGRLWDDLGAVAVEFPDEKPFYNINTPEDLNRWKKGIGR